MKLLQTETEVEKYRKVWQISEEEVIFGECIGRGAVGEVYRGKWRGINVAIKIVKGALMRSSEEMVRELDHEASMLQNVRHANVVQFFGMGTKKNGTPFIVIELMELGTLTEILRNDNIVLDWETKTRFALETAQGMALVHWLGRMHRDLKSRNILVTASGPGGLMRAKVADFGTAALAQMAKNASTALSLYNEFDDNDLPKSTASDTAMSISERVNIMRTKGIGTPLWMAPEILGGSSTYDASADVYSYGIVMWEIASRREPWTELSGRFFMNRLLEKLNSGIRPRIEDTWPKSYVALMEACWATSPHARPPFSIVVQRLESEMTP